MILLTPASRAALVANGETRMRSGHFDPRPVVKFFNPLGFGRWFATELYPDGDTLFGLADLGFGCSELGTFSLSELASVRLPFGLGIERDLYFDGRFALSVYAEAGRRAGKIVESDRTLADTLAAMSN